MQVANSVGARPTSVTVICYLGIVVPALVLLLLPGVLVVASKIPVLFISFFANALINIGFIIACVLMLQANKHGKLLYHVVSVCWLLESIFEFFLVFSVIGVDRVLGFTLQSEHAMSVVAYDLVSGLMFLIALVSLALFNVLLCLNKNLGYWKK